MLSRIVVTKWYVCLNQCSQPHTKGLAQDEFLIRFDHISIISLQPSRQVCTLLYVYLKFCLQQQLTIQRCKPLKLTLWHSSQNLREIRVSVERTQRGVQWGGDHRLHGQTTSTWPARLQLTSDTLYQPVVGTTCGLTGGEQTGHCNVDSNHQGDNYNY